MKAAALIIITTICLSGCEAMRPFARVDATGYEAGVRGKWSAVAAAIPVRPGLRE